MGTKPTQTQTDAAGLELPQKIKQTVQGVHLTGASSLVSDIGAPGAGKTRFDDAPAKIVDPGYRLIDYNRLIEVLAVHTESIGSRK